MRWNVDFDERARRDLAKLDQSIRRRVLDKLNWYEEHGDEMYSVPLHAEWSSFSKLRVGDWRIAYTVDMTKRLMTVRYIDHRDRIYKRQNR